MKKLYEVYCKKNEEFEIDFFEDKECTKRFDFEGKENVYLKDYSALPFLSHNNLPNTTIYIPYIPNGYFPYRHQINIDGVYELNNITPNLSKYIPEDNAVLFLSKDDQDKYKKCFDDCRQYIFGEELSYKETLHRPRMHYSENYIEYCETRLTIFLTHGTQSELQKANEVVKELKEKYGIEEVNLFVLHNFLRHTYDAGILSFLFPQENSLFNKIITTNSTGILEPQDSERLKVIDCKETFEEYLNNSLWFLCL